MRRTWRVAWQTVAILLFASPPGAQAAPDPGVSLAVVDSAGRPVAGLEILALPADGTGALTGGKTDATGALTLPLPRGAHTFEIVSGRWLLSGHRPLRAGWIELAVREAFPDGPASDVLRRAQQWVSLTIEPRRNARGPSGGREGSVPGLVVGRITDPSGDPVAGVRLLALDAASDVLIAVTLSEGDGHYALGAPAGPAKVVIYAPGLKIESATRRSGTEVDIALAIDAAAERVTLQEGRSIRFRMSDSLWPEYLPPAAVKGVLATSYGIDPENLICPGDIALVGPGSAGWMAQARFGITCTSPAVCPASVWQRQCKVAKYWWLKLLATEPPNPSRVSDRASDSMSRERSEIPVAPAR